MSWNERGCVRPIQVLLNEQSGKSQPLFSYFLPAASLPKESVPLVSVLLQVLTLNQNLYVLVSGLNNCHGVNTRHYMESV